MIVKNTINLLKVKEKNFSSIKIQNINYYKKLLSSNNK